jgi:hypothetical protein
MHVSLAVAQSHTARSAGSLSQLICTLGSRIPSLGLWSTTGNLRNCTNITGGPLFYAYNRPNPFSSNTAYEVFQSDVLYFIVDNADNIYFVLVHDMVNNGFGGFAKLKIDSPDLANRSVSVQLRDDPGRLDTTCENAAQDGVDCYAWSSTQGAGSFAWTWVSFDFFLPSFLPRS